MKYFSAKHRLHTSCPFFVGSDLFDYFPRNIGFATAPFKLAKGFVENMEHCLGTPGFVGGRRRSGPRSPANGARFVRIVNLAPRAPSRCQTSKTRVRAPLEIRLRAMRVSNFFEIQALRLPYPTCCPLVRFSHIAS